MKIKNALLTLALGLSLSGAVTAQVISYNPRTGDVYLDSQLGQMNDYGRNDRNYFVDDVVNSFGAPRYLVNDLLNTRRWDPGDVYYACALAYQARRPCGDVVKQYDQNRGQGWGVVAKNMGIKPGSAQFHALKGSVGKSNGKYKTHKGASGKHAGTVVDTSPGNSDKAKGYSDKAKGNSDTGKGNSDKAKGNSDKAKSNGNKH